MSNKSLEYVIKLKDGLSGVLRIAGSAVRRFAGLAGTAFRSITSLARGLVSSLTSLPTLLSGAALTGFATKAVQTFMVQEDAAGDLRTALILAGDASDKTHQKLMRFSGELQSLTRMGDEAAQSLMALGLNMEVPIDRIEETTIAAIGLAKAVKTDVQTAMKILAKLAAGGTADLGEYGIVLDQNLTKQEQFNELLRRGADSFALATAEANRTSGRWEQLKNVVGDFFELIGGKISEVFNLKGAFEELRKRIDDFIKSVAGQDKVEQWISRIKTGLEDVVGLFRVLFSGSPEQRDEVFGKLGKVLGSMFNLAAVGAVRLLVKAGPMIGAAIWVGFKSLLQSTAPKLAKHLGPDRLEQQAEDTYIAQSEFLARGGRLHPNQDIPSSRENAINAFGWDPREEFKTQRQIYAGLAGATMPRGMTEKLMDEFGAALMELHESIRKTGLVPEISGPPSPESEPPEAPSGGKDGVADHNARGIAGDEDLIKQLDAYKFSRLSTREQLDAVQQRIDAFRTDEATPERAKQLIADLKTRDDLRRQLKEEEKSEEKTEGGLQAGSLEDLFRAQRAGRKMRVIRMKGSMDSAFGRGVQADADGVKRMKGSMKSAFARSKEEILAKNAAARQKMQEMRGARMSGDNPEKETADNTYDMVKLLEKLVQTSEGVH